MCSWAASARRERMTGTCQLMVMLGRHGRLEPRPARVFQFQSGRSVTVAGTRTGAVRYVFDTEAVGVSSVCALRRQFDYLVSTRSPSHAATQPCHSPRSPFYTALRTEAQSVDQLSSNGSSCESTLDARATRTAPAPTYHIKRDAHVAYRIYAIRENPATPSHNNPANALLSTLTVTLATTVYSTGILCVRSICVAVLVQDFHLWQERDVALQDDLWLSPFDPPYT